MARERICLVGTGAAASRCARAVRGLGDARIVAVSGTDDAHRRRFAAQGGIERHYRDPEAMIRAETPDFVLIASRPADHERDVIRCGALCDRIVVEKPVAASPESIPRLRAWAGQEGKSLSVIYQRRFDESFRRLDQVFPAFRDRLRHISVVAVDRREAAYFEGAGAWRRDPALAGGGVLLQNGIHAVDLLLRLFPDAPRIRRAVCSYPADARVEDTAYVDLQCASHVTGAIYCSRESPALRNGLTLYGEDFSCTVESGRFLLRDSRSARRSFLDARWTEWLRGRTHPGGHEDCLRSFFERNQGARRESVFLADAFRDLEFIDRVYRWKDPERP